jgi:hypothetical protein
MHEILHLYTYSVFTLLTRGSKIEQFESENYYKNMREQFMQNETQEFEVQAVSIDNVKLYSEGIGVVAPTGEVSDVELVEAVTEAQKSVEDPHVVCIDEREGVEKQPVREKMAAGNLGTGYVAAELADWSLFTDEQRAAGPEARVEAVADHLVGVGEKLGAHKDNHAPADGSRSNCGAADGAPDGVEIIAEHGHDEQFETQMQDALGDNYDEAVFSGIINRAGELTAANKFAGWRGTLITDAVEERDGVVEKLNGDNKHPEKDPENKRHNHWAEGVYVNPVAGKSNDRDNAKIPFFQVDAPAIIRVCQEMASDEAEFSKLLHSAVAFQFAIRYKLTSDMRNVY